VPRGAMTPPARRREQALPLRALRRPRPSMRAPHWHWGEATQCFVAGSRAASEHVHVRAVTCGHRRWPPGGGIVAAAARASTPAGRAAGARGAECARPAAWLNAREPDATRQCCALRRAFPARLQTARKTCPQRAATGESRRAVTSRRHGGMSVHRRRERHWRPRYSVRVPPRGGNAAPRSGFPRGFRSRGRRGHHLWPLARAAGPWHRRCGGMGTHRRWERRWHPQCRVRASHRGEEVLRLGAGFPCGFRPRGRRCHHLWPLAGIAGS